ncbi:hypothetical protein D5R93_11725 [Actinomyces lilanjuaniae]|uniref:Uncharacterized protein n=1 Tax=Actinomyces lilanjuaniae TaxID=2321394 RepID=A0ABM6Z534_9ACTO|nr:hypothetical protein D5R93_11725 [Actinomyces lilanjuaniae]
MEAGGQGRPPGADSGSLVRPCQPDQDLQTPVQDRQVLVDRHVRVVPEGGGQGDDPAVPVRRQPLTGPSPVGEVGAHRVQLGQQHLTRPHGGQRVRTGGHPW